MSSYLKRDKRSLLLLTFTFLVVSVKLTLISMFFREQRAFWESGNYPWTAPDWYWNHIAFNFAITFGLYSLAYIKMGKEALRENYTAVLKSFFSLKPEAGFISFLAVLILLGAAVLIGLTTSWSHGVASLVYIYVLFCECTRVLVKKHNREQWGC
jgi:hypothetical protein